jgi:hypothetical protein
MKRLINSLVFLFLIFALNGCVTVPHHYTYIEEIIYYPPPPPDPYYPPLPPTSPVVNSPVPETRPQRDWQPEVPKDSYQKRDPLRGGSDRGNSIIKTDPPVRTPEQKQRTQK